MADLLILDDRLAASFDLEDGEEAAPTGDPLGERERDRERLWALWAGLRERLGERDGERPRERDREREELSDRERLLDLFLAASMSLIFLPLISFPDSLSMAFFRSLPEANSTTPSLSLGRCASANVTSPACLMKSLRSYTCKHQSTHGEARDTSSQRHITGLIYPKKEMVRFSERTTQATADKEDESKNLGGRLIIQ